MARVVVTGGSGKLGRAVVRDLRQHGYAVVNVDLAPPPGGVKEDVVAADLEDFGAALEVLSGIDDRHDGVDGVVHLAAIPAPGLAPNHTIFRRNAVSTYNVFEAARRAGVRNLVWASSETVLGLPFDTPPDRIPVDEASARPESAYALSKLVGETMAEQFCRWDPAMKIAGLRFSNVMEPDDYAAFPAYEGDAAARAWNLWGYVDARDGAQAVRRALEADFTGAEVFVIANADTVMSRANDELVAEVYPGVEYASPSGPNDTLLSIDKARRVLGYAPEHSWREESAG